MKVNKTTMAILLGTLTSGLLNDAQAAIALDRTRAIFPGSQKSISLNITNDSTSMPYLAQGWIEDEQGKKISGPLVVVPPLQRLEAKGKSVLRINAMPDAALLPQEIKLFYRPKAILPEKYSRWDNQLVLQKVNGGYRVENPTPYYMTVIGITPAPNMAVAKGFQSVMVAPKSTAMVSSSHFTTPHVTTINDFGGKPTLPFSCNGNVCRAAAKPAS